MERFFRSIEGIVHRRVKELKEGWWWNQGRAEEEKTSNRNMRY